MNTMCEETFKLLNLRRLPARLTAEQAAPLLGVMPYDLPVLVKAKLIKPLGGPRQQAVKYYSAVEIEQLSRDVAGLNRITKALYARSDKQNDQRRNKRRPAITSQLMAA
jgi:hypothetical protein